MSTRAKRTKIRLRGKKRVKLPTSYKPRLFVEADNRRAVVKELRRRVERLKEDCGATSYQQEMLCEEAVHLFSKLETFRVRELNGEDVSEFDGARTQMLNCLQGILAKLGLTKKMATADDLDDYLSRKKRKDDDE